MKFKNVLMTFGLAAVLGLGIGAGLGANKEVKQAIASGGNEETHLLYVAIATSTVESELYSDFNLRVNSQIGDGGTWRQTNMSRTTDTTTYTGKTVFVGTYTEKYGGVDKLQFQIYDGDTWKSEKEPISSWDTTNRTGYLFDYEDEAWITDYVPPTPITYVTVTKMAVEFVGGIASEPANWDLGSDSVVKGAVYSVPGGITKNFERFDGWFLDALCTSKYTARAINSDLTLYAKYTKLSADSYFYWTDKDSSTLTSVYFYGEYAPYAWPGTALSAFKVDDVLSYNGEGKLYKIPCPSTGSFKVQLNSGDGDNKTDNITVEPGKLLYTWDKKEYWDETEWWGGNFVDGSAADLVTRVEVARNAVVASSGILQYSVCGIDPEQARNLYNEYYDMSVDNKALVNASYTYTYKGSYDGEHVPSQDNILFSEIMLSLKKVAEDGGYSVKGSASYIFATNASSQYSSTGIIVAVAVATSALLIGGYFLLKKKKED